MSRKIKAPFKGVVTLFNVNNETSRKIRTYDRKIIGMPPRNDPSGCPQQYPFVKITHPDGQRYWTSPNLHAGAEVTVMDGDRVKKDQVVALWPRVRKEEAEMKERRHDSATRKAIDVMDKALKGKPEKRMSKFEKKEANAKAIRAALDRQSWSCAYGRTVTAPDIQGHIQLVYYADDAEDQSVIKVAVAFSATHRRRTFTLVKEPYPKSKKRSWVAWEGRAPCDIGAHTRAYSLWWTLLMSSMDIDSKRTVDVTDYSEPETLDDEPDDYSGVMAAHMRRSGY
jgi:hypothetical protein